MKNEPTSPIMIIGYMCLALWCCQCMMASSYMMTMGTVVAAATSSVGVKCKKIKNKTKCQTDKDCMWDGSSCKSGINRTKQCPTLDTELCKTNNYCVVKDEKCVYDDKRAKR